MRTPVLLSLPGLTMLLLVLASLPAFAQVARDADRDHALLVGLCLAAAQERMALSDLELAMAGEIQTACERAPGPTLYKLRGGRVFDAPTDRGLAGPPRPPAPRR
jgi:hypothetical protein